MIGDEHGGSTVVAMMLVAIILVVTIAVASLAALVGARAQASTAADAAALAAAVASYPPAGGGDPVREAVHYAVANSARLVRCDCGVDPSLAVRTVEVIVSVGVDVPLFGALDVAAGARGEFDPVAWLGP